MDLHSSPRVKRTAHASLRGYCCFMLPIQVCLNAFICGEDGQQDVTLLPRVENVCGTDIYEVWARDQQTHM